MKKLLLFIGITALSCSFGYGSATSLYSVQSPVPQLPAELQAKFNNDLRAFYNNIVATKETPDKFMPPTIDTHQVVTEYLRILNEYNLQELAIESGYYSPVTDIETSLAQRKSEGTPEYQKVVSYYANTPPTIENIIANDNLLPLEKLQVAFVVAMLP